MLRGGCDNRLRAVNRWILGARAPSLDTPQDVVEREAGSTKDSYVSRYAARTSDPVSARDHVVDVGDLRRTRVDAKFGQDRNQRLAECLKQFLRLPDVEDLDLAVGLQSHVVQPTRRRAGPGLLELLDRFVVLGDCERTRGEIQAHRHRWLPPLWSPILPTRQARDNP